jgi:hypothetical protein
MSTLDRLRGRSPQKSPPKSPTSSPLVRPPDPTITSTLPFLRTLYSTPGTHNTASFLRTVFTEYLRLQHDITHSSPERDDRDDDDDDGRDRITLQKMKDMIALTKMIRGIPGHEKVKFHVVEYDLQNDTVTKFWMVLIPLYRLSDDTTSSQRPTLDLGNLHLLNPTSSSTGPGLAADLLPTPEYERMLLVLVSHIVRILGSDCCPVVMRPVLTDRLRGYLEPLTRMGKWDSIEFPAAVEGQSCRPRFRLLGLSDREVRRRGWVREGEFGWSHVQEQQQQIVQTDEKKGSEKS